MPYLVQQTRVSSLTINGEDVTSSLVSFQVADASANRNGIITTTGTILLGQQPGAADLTDYYRREYKRGEVVILDMQEPGGSVYRHPRGYLYVLSSVYDVESEQRSIEVGCRLSLAYLTDEPEALLPLAPIPLDPAQQTVENVAASFQSAGQVLWQDNQGALQSNLFFGTDSTSGIEPGEWVSVLGQTAIQVSASAGSGAIPDEIELSYSVPVGTIEDDGTGRVDTTTEVSKYFVNYPAVTYQRVPEGGADECVGENCGGFSDDGACGGQAECFVIYTPVPSVNTLASSTSSSGFTRFPSASSGCGNVPSAPSGSIPASSITIYDPNQPPPVSCDELWETVNGANYLPATRTSTSVSEYKAVGAQISRSYEEVYGPAVEVNSQYWSDKYAYCRNLYGRECVPSGNCPYDGMSTIRQRYSEQLYYYGTANELVKTVRDEYLTLLSAAEATDWRSGVVDGIAQDFRTLSTGSMYRARRTVVEYYKEDNISFEKTTNYDSIASRNSGISIGAAQLDALKGIITSSLRASSSTTAAALRPDSVNSGTTDTKEQTTRLILNRRQEYTDSPLEAGPYEQEESIPAPLLFNTAEEVQEVVDAYSEYIVRMTQGQERALTIGESLRSEIVTGWRPGMPFRFVDNSVGVILAMRMDSCAWGVTLQESAVAMTGVWIGESSGTYVEGSNVVGNSTPVLSSSNNGISQGGTEGSPTPPANVVTPPSILNDEVPQGIIAEINVDMHLTGYVDIWGSDGVVPPQFVPAEARGQFNFMVTTRGQVVEQGGLLSPLGNGGIPISGAGILLTNSAVIITPDLFS